MKRFYSIMPRLVAITTFLLAFMMPKSIVFAQSNSPLCFTARNGNAYVKFGFFYGIPSIQYSTDGSNWQAYSSYTGVLLDENQSVYFRAASNHSTAFAYGNANASNSSRFYFTGNGVVEASGNIMSLYGPDCPDIQLTDYAFSNMFHNCTTLITAPSLPATLLASHCYSAMFSGCSALQTVPSLPASTLMDGCYSGMFKGCANLTEISELPATILAKECYSFMFSDCSSLNQPPVLPASSLAEDCYEDMFRNCTSLTVPPALPAITLANSCYCGMFMGCTSLTTIPSLPATTLSAGCYQMMFYGCSNLYVNTAGPGTPWIIPATDWVSSALSNMFYGTSGNMNNTPSLNTTYYISDTAVYYTVAVTVNDYSMGGVSGDGAYLRNETVTLTASPYDGYVFDGWSNGAKNEVIQIKLVSDTVLYANFKPQETDIEYVSTTHLNVYSCDGKIYVCGVTGETITIYDTNGRLVAVERGIKECFEIEVESSGVYIVIVEGKNTIKVEVN